MPVVLSRAAYCDAQADRPHGVESLDAPSLCRGPGNGSKVMPILADHDWRRTARLA